MRLSCAARVRNSLARKTLDVRATQKAVAAIEWDIIVCCCCFSDRSQAMMNSEVYCRGVSISSFLNR